MSVRKIHTLQGLYGLQSQPLTVSILILRLRTNTAGYSHQLPGPPDEPPSNELTNLLLKTLLT